MREGFGLSAPLVYTSLPDPGEPVATRVCEASVIPFMPKAGARGLGAVLPRSWLYV